MKCRRRPRTGYLPPKQRNSIIAALRRCFSRSEEHRYALAAAKSPSETGPRGGKMYVCANCDHAFPVGEVQVDHIHPVIPPEKTTSDMTWDEIITRMFCDHSKLQVLCKKCHVVKSGQERKMRQVMKRKI